MGYSHRERRDERLHVIVVSIYPDGTRSDGGVAFSRLPPSSGTRQREGGGFSCINKRIIPHPVTAFQTSWKFQIFHQPEHLSCSLNFPLHWQGFFLFRLLEKCVLWSQSGARMALFRFKLGLLLIMRLWYWLPNDKNRQNLAGQNPTLISPDAAHFL